MKRTCLYIIIVLFIFQPGIIRAQKEYRTFFQYLDPLPGSERVSPLNNILFRLADKLNDHNSSQVSVELKGSESGIIKGELRYISEDNIYI